MVMALRRKTRLRPGAGPRRKTWIRRRNAKRAKAAWTKAYGSAARVEWINSMKCECKGKHPSCSGPTQNAHETSRGAGGTASNVVPMSSGCHAWQHRFGIHAWCKAAGMTRDELKAKAAELATKGPDAPRGERS